MRRSKGSLSLVSTASMKPAKSAARLASEGITCGSATKRILGGGLGSERSKPSHSSVTTKVKRKSFDLERMSLQRLSMGLIHILRHCSFATSVWDLIQPGLPGDFFTSPLPDWIATNCKPSHQPISTSIPWETLFPFILWCLWLRRNNLIYSNSSSTPNACLDKAKALALDFHLYRDPLPSTNTPTTNPATWIPPPQNHWHLNVDASFSSPDLRAGLAGVIRDCNGFWMTGYMKTSTAQSALMAEILAILEGLHLVVSSNFNQGTIISDSTVAVTLINDENLATDVHKNLIHECRHLMWEAQVRLEHAPRTTNGVADLMAKHCRKHFVNSTLCILDQPPEVIMNMYLEEIPP